MGGTELRTDARHGLLPLRFVADVDVHGEGCSARRRDLANQALGAVVVDVRHRDRGAGRAEATGHGGPDPRRRAGHDRHSAFDALNRSWVPRSRRGHQVGPSA